MKTFRIKEHTDGFGTSYEIQRKSIFGFWYNPENVDGCTTGFYDSLEKITEHIRKKKVSYTTEIIDPETVKKHE